MKEDAMITFNKKTKTPLIIKLFPCVVSFYSCLVKDVTFYYVK